MIGFALLNRSVFFFFFFRVVMAATGIQLTLLNWSLFFPKATTLDPVFMLLVCDSEALVVFF